MDADVCVSAGGDRPSHSAAGTIWVSSRASVCVLCWCWWDAGRRNNARAAVYPRKREKCLCSNRVHTHRHTARRGGYTHIHWWISLAHTQGGHGHGAHTTTTTRLKQRAPSLALALTARPTTTTAGKSVKSRQTHNWCEHIYAYVC